MSVSRGPGDAVPEREPGVRVRWRFATEGRVNSTPAAGRNGSVYVGSTDGALYALDGKGGLRWSFKTAGEVHSSPRLGPDGVCYFGSNDGRLYAVAEDGAL